MADEPENLVLTLLRQLGAKIDHVDAKTDRMAADIATVKTDVAAIKATQQTQGHVLSVLRHAIAPGEMESASEDLRQLRQDVDALTMRLEAIEERNKDH